MKASLRSHALPLCAVIALLAPSTAIAQECVTCWTASCDASLRSYLQACPAAGNWPACPAGQAQNEGTSGHCCWPEQEWSKRKAKCIGVPGCPPGWKAVGETCVAAAPSAKGGAAARGTVSPQPAPKRLGVEVVKATVARSRTALQRCVDEVLKERPRPRVGKVHVLTLVAPTGFVTSVAIDKADFNNTSGGVCLKDVVKQMRFPAFDGDELEVDIPLVVTTP